MPPSPQVPVRNTGCDDQTQRDPNRNAGRHVNPLFQPLRKYSWNVEPSGWWRPSPAPSYPYRFDLDTPEFSWIITTIMIV
jgi:hypothetical protein